MSVMSSMSNLQSGLGGKTSSHKGYIHIGTPSSCVMAGVEDQEQFIQVPRLFDSLANNLLVYRCDISGNSWDGILSWDYHLEIIGG